MKIDKNSTNQDDLGVDTKEWLHSLLPELKQDIEQLSKALVVRGQTRATNPFDMSLFDPNNLPLSKEFSREKVEELLELITYKIETPIPIENGRMVLTKTALKKLKAVYNFLNNLNDDGFKRNIIFSEETGIYDPKNKSQVYKVQKTRGGKPAGAYLLIKYLVTHRDISFDKLRVILNTDETTDISNRIDDINKRFKKRLYETDNLIVHKNTGGYYINPKFIIEANNTE